MGLARNNSTVTKQELVTRIERGRGEFLSALADIPDETLTQPNTIGMQEYDPNGPLCAIHGDTIDGALGNNTYGHYAEHLPEVQAWLRART